MKEPTEEMIQLALAIVNSEQFMWLMVGSTDWQESHLSDLRPVYQRFTELGGGWGK